MVHCTPLRFIRPVQWGVGMKELSQTEYATARGVSPAYVTKLKRQGRLVLTPGGKVNVEATDRLIESTRDPARGGDRRPGAGEDAGEATDARIAAAPGAPRPGGGGFQTYKEAARRERIAKARIAELELAEKTGQLVRKEEVAAAIFGLSRQAMEALDALADRLASQLAAESDVARVHELITEHARKIRVAMVGALPGLPEAMEKAA